MSEVEQREEAVFEAALKLPADQRAAYLDKACSGNVRLRHRVEGLLGAFDRAGGFLNEPAIPSPDPTVRCSLPVAEKAGDKIGRYKLLQQIGEGGCGVVYVADQEEPLRRRVALKIIKLGMDTKQVIARFEAERQALAMMEHPNIAKVLDAGATDTGRPYFVMELVRGIRITQFCDENKLSTEERLKLFVPICQAIQHAHQKGVIHRDIKPSNVLVTINDGVPVPKVIDFGIAKATAGRLTDQTVYTALEQFIGTPAYMSPEQAVMTSLDIDTRSDIYSLGVMLYELLTGSTPFDQKELLKVGIDEMRRTIREQEPPRPSHQRSTMAAEELTTTAKRRRTDVSKLVHLLRGDLDWIVLKCLEKDRARRYETANGLAMDVQRHLNDEPVVARPPSKLYELQKALHRHKFGFAAGAVLMMALTLGGAVSMWQFVEKSRALQRAVEAEQEQALLTQRAEGEAEKNTQFAQFMKDILSAAGPSVARGRDPAVLKEILQKTAERVTKELKDQPEVQGDLWFTLGTTYNDIGVHAQAVLMFGNAAASYRLALGDENTKLALSLGKLGRYQSFGNNISEGSSNAALGLQIARKCGDADTIASCLHDRARALDPYGLISEKEEPFLREAVTVRRGLGNDPIALADCLSSWGLAQRPYDKASIREALSLYLEHLEPDHPKVGLQRFVLGEALLEDNQFEAAESELRQAMELLDKLWTNENRYRLLVRRYLARALLRQDKAREAETVLREGMEHGLTPFVRRYYLNALAEAVVRQGDFDRSDPLLRTLADAHDQPEVLLSSLMQEAMLSDRLQEFEAFLESRSNLLHEIRVFERVKNLVSDHAAWAGLGDCAAVDGTWSTAIRDFSRALELLPSSTDYPFNLGIVLLRSGDEDSYRLHCHEYLTHTATNGEFVSAERAAKVSLLLPVDGNDFTLACELADFAASVSDDQWGSLTKALAEERRGHHDAARRWTGRSVLQDPSNDPERAAAAWFIQALACVGLGDITSAQAALSKGDKLLARPRSPAERWKTWRDLEIAKYLREQVAESFEDGPAAQQPARTGRESD